jgi:hypothetical protein
MFNHTLTKQIRIKIVNYKVSNDGIVWKQMETGRYGQEDLYRKDNKNYVNHYI